MQKLGGGATGVTIGSNRGSALQAGNAFRHFDQGPHRHGLIEAVRIGDQGLANFKPAGAKSQAHNCQRYQDEGKDVDNRYDQKGVDV